MIAVKDNQPKLFQTIKEFFSDHLERDLEELRYRESKTEDVGHGRIDERTLGNNLSWLRRFAITRLKHHPLKESLRGKRQIAGWNDDFLAEVLTGQ